MGWVGMSVYIQKAAARQLRLFACGVGGWFGSPLSLRRASQPSLTPAQEAAFLPSPVAAQRRPRHPAQRLTWTLTSLLVRGATSRLGLW